MCGIAGIVVRDGTVNSAAVKAMCDLMAHRGPDGEGIWQSKDGLVAFGHRRLAIIDLSRDADQPMADADGELHITYNGEIYNYLEVRAALEGKGHRFRTRSDTEVILEAYRAWGADCVEHFNGMFAFAIWDTVNGALFCARDRFGEKPFLYASGDGFFAFASEYKALLTLDGVDGRFSDAKLGGFFVESSRALDRGLRDLLHSSVRLRMRSDVPVGSCLSGGLDSGSIARESRRPAFGAWFGRAFRHGAVAAPSGQNLI